MRIHTLRREQELDGTPDEVFPFFADAFNLEAITPPLLRFRVVTPGPIDMHAGTLIQYRLRLRGVPVTLEDADPGVDAAAAGSSTRSSRAPTRSGTTPTRSTRCPGERTLMTDTVRYAIGFGALGELAHRALVRRDVEAIFDYRREALVPLLARDVRRPAPRPDRRTRD